MEGEIYHIVKIIERIGVSHRDMPDLILRQAGVRKVTVDSTTATEFRGFLG